MGRNQVVGLLVAMFVGVAYGSSLVVARLSYDHGTTFFTIVALRYLCLTVALAVWLRVSGVGIDIPRHLAVRSAAVGALSVLASISYLATVAYIPVSLGTLVFYTHPLITALLAALLMGMRSTRVELAAAVLAFAGLAVVLEVSFSSLHPLGLLFGVLASVLAAVIFIPASPIINAVGSLRFTFYLALSGAGIACLAAAFTNSVAFPPDSHGWGLLAATVLLNVAGLLGMFVAVKFLGPVATPMVLNLEPITAIVLAVLVIGEQLSSLQIIASSVILAAILVAQASRARKST